MIPLPRLVVLTGCLLSITSGCTTFGNASSWTGGPPAQSEPAVEESDDKWGFVGKEARGNRALEDEKDPLKPYLMSPKARDIERNLGYK